MNFVRRLVPPFAVVGPAIVLAPLVMTQLGVLVGCDRPERPQPNPLLKDVDPINDAVPYVHGEVVGIASGLWRGYRGRVIGCVGRTYPKPALIYQLQIDVDRDGRFCYPRDPYESGFDSDTLRKLAAPDRGDAIELHATDPTPPLSADPA